MRPAKTADNRPMDQYHDYYEIMQISPSAEPETIHRVYRLLAQRWHPDNAETGDDRRFQMLTEAYQILSDPQERARYDVIHSAYAQRRWRVVSSNAQVEGGVEAEQVTRLMLLELLYVRRRTETDAPGLSLLDLEALTGHAREHLEFTIWYLTQKKFVTRSDGSVLTITVDGVDYLEKNFRATAQQRLLAPGPVPADVKA